MSKRPRFQLIQGGLTQEQRGIYELRERRAAAPEPEAWPAAGAWRRLIRSIMRNPRDPAKGD